MRRLYVVSAFLMLLGFLTPAAAQMLDRRDVRKGNRDFRKEDWKNAEIDYRKALVKDSTSFAANYNLANTLYRQGEYDEAAKSMEKIGQAAVMNPYASDYYFNAGDIAIQQKDWKKAVDSFRQALLRTPDDLDAKENYIYAKKMLENQQGGGGGGQNNQDQNQNQDQQQNQQNQDQQQDQNQNQNQNQDQQNQDQQQDQGGESQISPQQAQQMLQAIQAREKETQDKVNKEKAAALKSRQKEKNW
ncbi:MAG: tetratricopeptide repeat protein [Bacteroidales bacterium]|nr:tetratricopeptide repeat protein [Bacteroidales bacterium]